MHLLHCPGLVLAEGMGKWDELLIAKLNSRHQKVSPWHNFDSFGVFWGLFFFFPLTKSLARQETVMFKELCEKLDVKGFICTLISVHSGDANLSPD